MAPNCARGRLTALLLASLVIVGGRRCHVRRTRTDQHMRRLRSRRRILAPVMVSKEDAESNARLVEALFGGVEEAAAALEKRKDIPSHMQLDLDDDGNPTQLRFAYVDEAECIGCTYCADVARNTFYMNEDAGRARVFAQGQDEPDVVMEAIECCPVNCISFVDLEDLVILETERMDEVISGASIGIPATWSVSMNRPASKAKMASSKSMVCCNNCPSKGCKECPMYGVGLNPAYIERLEARKAKKEASGQAAKERFDDDAASKIGVLFDPNAAPVEVAAAQEQSEEEMPEEYWVEVDCPSYVFAGEMISAETPDGDRIEVEVPEWAESGGSFWVAYNELDGEWAPRFRLAVPEKTTTGVVVPAKPQAPAAAKKNKGPAELSMPSIAEMESADGVVVPTGEGAEETVDVFAALYSNPYDDEERFGDMPM